MHKPKLLLLCGLTLFIENKLSCHLVCKLSSLYAPCRTSSSLRYVSFQAFTFNFAILKFGYVWEILWGLIFGALLLRVSHVQICVDLSKCLYFFCLCIPLLFIFFGILFSCGLDLECWRGCDFRWNLISVGSIPVFFCFFCFFNCVGSWLIWILEI